MSPQAYCTAKAGSIEAELRFAFFFTPRERRDAIDALLAFAAELRETVHKPGDSGVARLKLEWWREEISRAGERCPRHPVTRALVVHSERCNVPWTELSAMVDGAEMDLRTHRYPSRTELRHYCESSLGSLLSSASAILDAGTSIVTRMATDLGAFSQSAFLIQNLGADLRRGRCCIPRERCGRLETRPWELSRSTTPALLVRALEAETAEARRDFRHALRNLEQPVMPALGPALALAMIADATLAEIQRDGFRVMEKRLELAPWRMLWISWRTAIGCRGGKPLR